MKNKSYKIKHDFLFDGVDTDIVIPVLDKSDLDHSYLYMSSIMKADNIKKFDKLLKVQSNVIVLVDDIGHCLNPQADKYKKFLFRCFYRKLKELNFDVYI